MVLGKYCRFFDILGQALFTPPTGRLETLQVFPHGLEESTLIVTPPGSRNAGKRLDFHTERILQALRNPLWPRYLNISSCCSCPEPLSCRWWRPQWEPHWQILHGNKACAASHPQDPLASITSPTRTSTSANMQAFAVGSFFNILSARGLNHVKTRHEDFCNSPSKYYILNFCTSVLVEIWHFQILSHAETLGDTLSTRQSLLSCLLPHLLPGMSGLEVLCKLLYILQ